jgi:hypothetical protein
VPDISFVFYSTNQGQTWQGMGEFNGGSLQPVPEINQDDQDGNNLALVASPTDPVAFITGSAGDVGSIMGHGAIYRGDYTMPTVWQPVTAFGATGNPPGGTAPAAGTAPHSDGRTLVFDPNGNLLLSDDGGIYRLVNPDALPSGDPSTRYWESVDGNIRPTEFYSVDYDSIDHIIVGGAQDNGFGEQIPNDNFAWNTGLGDDVTFVAVDNSASAATLYAMGTNFDEFMRGPYSQTSKLPTLIELRAPGSSMNFTGLNSADTTFLNSDDLTYIPFALDAVPADASHLVLGHFGLYESNDGSQGDFINDITPAQMQNQSTVSVSAVAYGGFMGSTPNPSVLYMGNSAGQLFVRTSGSAAPTLVNTFGSAVLSIALDPANWQTAYVVVAATATDATGQAFMTTNAGSSWTEITGNLGNLVSKLRTIEVVEPPNIPGAKLLLVGGLGGVLSSSGVFFTNLVNGAGTNWSPLGSGLPNTQVFSLHYDPTDDVLIAGTFGRGAWTISHFSQTLPATPAVFRAGTWFLDNGQVPYSPATTTTFQFGTAGDLAVSGDWLGTGQTEVGVFRPSTGTWYLDTTNTSYNPAATIQIQFGMAGDVPIVGRWLGNGISYVGVFRPSTGTWYLDTVMPAAGVPAAYSTATTIQVAFGMSGDNPVAGNWLGGGFDRIGVFRPATGTWFLDEFGTASSYRPAGTGAYSAATTAQVQFGSPGDIPVVGDWQATGAAHIGVWRPSAGTWFLDSQMRTVGNSAYSAATTIQVQYGAAGDRPVPGAWLGDGGSHIAVWRPSNGNWFLDQAPVSVGPPPASYSAATTLQFQFGADGDMVLTGQWLIP